MILFDDQNITLEFSEINNSNFNDVYKNLINNAEINLVKTRSGLRINKRINYRNSFQKRLFIEKKDNRFEVYFKVLPVVKLFTYIWFSFVIFIGTLMVIASLSDFKRYYIGIIIPSGMVLFGIFLVKTGLFMSNKEAPFLKETLKKALLASTR